jgi:hypothetical protein
MAKSDTKDCGKYFASLKERGYDKLKPSKYSINDPLLLDKLAAEGLKLLDSNPTPDPVKPQPPQKSLETALGEKSNNPYVKARMKVLADMPLSRRERILKMEKDNTTEHSFDYKDFVNRVRKLGDEYSNVSP